MKRIFVVGSLNIDLVVECERLPLPGETIKAGDLAFIPGGKGANQACAAARLGGDVRMIGQLGSDPFASALENSLGDAGVNTSGIRHSEGATGSALIYIMPGGQNSIVVSPGANATLTPEIALTRMSDLHEGDLVLLQLEVPFETVLNVARYGRRMGASVILDPAPIQPLPESLWPSLDWITPNETEAASIMPGLTDVEGWEVRRRLSAFGTCSTLLKLGARGCRYASEESVLDLPAFAVEAVDTTAAGDVFNGAFAVALSESRSASDAAAFASAAAAISVTRKGAQTSIPSRVEVDAFLAERGALLAGGNAQKVARRSAHRVRN